MTQWHLKNTQFYFDFSNLLNRDPQDICTETCHARHSCTESNFTSHLQIGPHPLPPPSLCSPFVPPIHPFFPSLLSFPHPFPPKITSFILYFSCLSPFLLWLSEAAWPLHHSTQRQRIGKKKYQLHREPYKLPVKFSVFGIHYLSSVEMG